MKSNTSSITNQNVCPSQLPYLWNGNSYNAAGTYNVTLINADGCDSVATLNLSLKVNTSSITNQSVCSSQLPYLWNGNSYNAAGTYSVTLINAAGCDSLATLNLSVKSSTFSTTNHSICSSAIPYIWNGNSYSAAGTYTATLVNAAGCDSVATLNLTVKLTTASTTNQSVCLSQLPYLWNGNSYNAPGAYTVTLVNAAGCDSIATLNLTVKSNTSTTTNQSVCPSQLPYLWNGNSYSTAGTYTVTLINAAGCDSVATLNLSVKPNTSSTTNQSVCPSQLPYLWNGNSYNAAGTYTVTLINAAGCDSVATLGLTVNSNTSSTTNFSICPSQLPFVWNGNSYNAAGTYTVTIPNAAGCDSVVNLILTLKANSISTANVSVCPSQLPYVWNGNSYNAAGTYSITLPNAAGCDSIITLTLIVKPNSATTTNIDVCENQIPFVWNGNSYNTAGTYSITMPNAAGCDSLITLVLIIKPNPDTAIVSSNSPICAGDTLILTASSSIAGATFEWTGPAVLNQSSTISVSNASVANAGIYSASAIVNGCKGAPDSTIVTIYKSPVVNAGNDKELREGDSVMLTPVISGSNLRYLWTPSLYFLTADTLKNPYVLGVKNITYRLTVTGDSQCVATDDIAIKVLPRVKPITFTNSFSPNGDGINDVWSLRPLAAYPDGTVEVFNRYGTVVFKAAGTIQSWDGTSKGKPVPSGIYYYIIHTNEKTKPISGYLTIVR